MKGAGPDDGVMSPIVAKSPASNNSTRWRRSASRAGWRIAGDVQKKRFGVDERGRSLNDADIGMRLHQLHEIDDGLAGHQTVGVEHDKIAVMFAQRVQGSPECCRFFFRLVPECGADKNIFAKGAEDFGQFQPAIFLIDPVLRARWSRSECEKSKRSISPVLFATIDKEARNRS